MPAANMAFSTLCSALPSSVAGDEMGPHQRHLCAVVVDHDLVAVEPELKNDRRLTEPDVFAHQFMLGIARHVHDPLCG